MNAQDFTPIAKNQIDGLRMNIAALEALKAAAIKFDGKIVNKRFADYYETIAPTAQRWDGATVPAAWLSFDSSYYNTPRLVMRDRDAGRAQIIFYKNKIYGQRMNAANFNAEIDGYMKAIREQIASFEDVNRNFEKIMDKYRAIGAELERLKKYSFIKNYAPGLDYQTRQLMDVVC